MAEQQKPSKPRAKRRRPTKKRWFVLVVVIGLMVGGVTGFFLNKAVSNRKASPAPKQSATIKASSATKAKIESSATTEKAKPVNKTELAASLGWGEVSSGNTSKKQIALTFDGAAGATSTTAFLDVLKDADLHCTFFLAGQFADSYPDIAKRIVAEGHELGNHSDAHRYFTRLKANQVQAQVQGAEDKIQKLTGVSTKPYFRFPYGSRNEQLIKQVNDLGYISVYWTYDTQDWQKNASSEMLHSRVMSNASPGAIILMHCDSPHEPEALPGIIKDLQAAGYKLVTLTEVLTP